MADIAQLRINRRIIFFAQLIFILLLAAYYTSVWANEIYLYDLQGRYWGTVAEWIGTWWNMLITDPWSIIFYTGWGADYPRIALLGTIVLAAAWIIGRTKTWQKYVPDCKIVDCRPQYLIFLFIAIPTLLSIYGAGAKLNLFFDTLANVPFYPWHDFAHYSASYIIFAQLVPIDWEGIFINIKGETLKYRWKFIEIMTLAWLLSMIIETKESLIVKVLGLSGGMFNNIIDSLPVDHKAVLFGAVTALLVFNGIQYRS